MSEKDGNRVVLHGTGASAGKYTGTVRLLDASAVGVGKRTSGDVLVTQFLTPFHVSHFTDARAIVTDRGGMTSHAALVARELGIPCVVGTGNATSVLKEGMKVVVDGVRGVVSA